MSVAQALTPPASAAHRTARDRAAHLDVLGRGGRWAAAGRAALGQDAHLDGLVRGGRWAAAGRAALGQDALRAARRSGSPAARSAEVRS